MSADQADGQAIMLLLLLFMRYKKKEQEMSRGELNKACQELTQRCLQTKLMVGL